MPRLGTVPGRMAPIGGRSAAPFNDATGGTITTFSYSGKNYRRHTFTTSGTLTVLNAADLFRVIMIGGGGDSGYADCPTAGGTAGGWGGAYTIDTLLAPGALAVTVGAANGSSTLATVGTVGYGGHGCRQWNSTGWTVGGTGTWAGDSTGAQGEPCGGGGPGADPRPSHYTLRDGTSISAYGVRGPGVPGNPCGFNAGTAGIVVVEYVIP